MSDMRSCPIISDARRAIPITDMNCNSLISISKSIELSTQPYDILKQFNLTLTARRSCGMSGLVCGPTTKESIRTDPQY